LHSRPTIPLPCAVAERRFRAVAVHGHVEIRPVDRVRWREDISALEEFRGSPLGGSGQASAGAVISGSCPRPRFA
jgi:hypothetical protein